MTFRAVLRWVRRIWLTAGLTVMALMAWNVQAHGVPASMFESDGRTRVVSTSYGRTFTPLDRRMNVPSLIFLPGGLIDPNAYVPLVRSVAEAGVPASIVELPMRSAPTLSLRAILWTRIRSALADLGRDRPVFVAGHSRGGMFAAEFAADHPTEIAGLVLIGTTHPRERDLSRALWPVMKIQGSVDCVAPARDSRANAPRLPAGTHWVEIAGGNHRQFGYYGWQIGDCPAAISREEQHRQTAHAIITFLTASE